ncbi:MAG: hypothetical protein GY953_42460 [bacterium]|nr:hypothetical protein [bacterium]
MGKFLYTGRRKDDSNDLIPHQRRRELRGLRVIASWINHADGGDKNTLDCYVSGAAGGGYIRHYLLDFGSAIGSGNFFNGPYRVGHEYDFDGSAIGRALLTLGIWERPWEAQGKIHYLEVGYYPAGLFQPEKWKPTYPNIAFERMDKGDAYWGAKIVTAFSDETIDRLTEAGRYSRDEVAAHLADVLRQRRDAIGRYWLDQVTPLEEFEFHREGAQGRLRFRDLAVERGYAEAESRAYRFWVEDSGGRELVNGNKQASNGDLALRDVQLPDREAVPGSPDGYGRTPVIRVLVQSNRRQGGWALPVEVVLGYPRDGPDIEVLGWRHAARK